MPALVRAVRLLIRKRGAYIPGIPGEAAPGTGGWDQWRGRTGAAALAGEALALAVVIASATALSRSCLLHCDNRTRPDQHRAPPPRRQPGAAGRP
jgi:hypothetical protein